jgi:hypothetical protein
VKGAIYDHFIFNGYSVTREFDSQDYGKPVLIQNINNRTTLYCAHDISTDTRGLLKFHFNSSAQVQKFRLVIQGMDADGRLVYAEHVF